MSAFTRQRRIRGDGLDLSVFETESSAGPTVVCLHGYPDTHRVWEPVAAVLAGRFHVVAPDIRGAGESGVPDTAAGYDLDHLVADIGAVIDAASPDAPVHLVGHDWGSVQGWEAVAGGRLDGRIASYTSLSGPSLDHVARWVRDRASQRRWFDLVVQGLRSWYVASFQIPRLPEIVWRRFGADLVTRYLERVERVPADRMPGPTLATDAANGVNLYRRNVPERFRRPRARTTDLPVQLLVARRDRFVTPRLLADVGHHAPNLHRVETDGRHWDLLVRPDDVAERIAAFVSGVQAA